jgi:D-alanyl-D-alanine carboxypeptidase (penicillin-binding protein 5/6)
MGGRSLSWRVGQWATSLFAGGLAIALVTAAPAGATVRRAHPRWTPVTTTSSTVPTPPPPPRSWILVDIDTGRVVDQHEAHVRRRPASTIKLLTMLTAEHHVGPDSMVTVSPLAASMPARKIGLAAGQTWPFHDLLSTAIVVSANDAAVAIAEQSGGSLDGFTSQMEETARSLGMVDTPQVEDPAGLDDSFAHGGGDWISAWDLALTGRAALADPAIATAARRPIVRFTDPEGRAHRLLNHNKLLSRYPGATGLKTGYTAAAGNSLVATATRDNRTMMVVVLDAPDLYDPVTTLLDQGFMTPVDAETGPQLAGAISPNDARVLELRSGAVHLSHRQPWPLEALTGAFGIGLVTIGHRRARRQARR